MLDVSLRTWIGPSLDRIAARLAKMGVHADWVTWSGFALGLCALPTIAGHAYWAGLCFIALNRVFDGLDGPIARHTKVSDFGAFLDIALDFIFYPAIPFAFALAMPDRVLAALFLIFSFAAAGTTLLAYAAIAAKRGLAAVPNGGESLYRVGGLTAGSAAFLAFALACIFPNWFSMICYVFGTLCFVFCGLRIASAVADLRMP